MALVVTKSAGRFRAGISPHRFSKCTIDNGLTGQYKGDAMQHTQSAHGEFKAKPVSLFMSGGVILCKLAEKFLSLPILRGRKPETGYLFPPSQYCPAECERCQNPCKLPRYHVGPHWCGYRHGGNVSRFLSYKPVENCFGSTDGCFPLVPVSLVSKLYNFLKFTRSPRGKVRPCSYQLS